MRQRRDLMDLLWIFATGFLWSAGTKIGDYFATRLALWRAEGPPPFMGTPDRALCPQCGLNLYRFSRSLYCQRCGYREG